MAKKILELKEFFNGCTVENNLLSTPMLWTKTKTNLGTWQGHVLATVDTADHKDTGDFKREKIIFEAAVNGVYFTTYSLKEGGKLITSAPTLITKGTNIGRANETTAFQQAVSKIMTKYNDKVKEGATADRETVLTEISFDTITGRPIENPNRINVMALHNVANNWKKVKFPCIVQPKYDGIHIIANCHGGLDLFSRGMSKKISQNHIRKPLEFLCKPEWRGYYITGEMWAEGVSRQNIASIVGQELDENIQTRLPIYIFDVFSVDHLAPFEERLEWIKEAVKLADSEWVRAAEFIRANTREELEKYYQKQLDLKMEGVVIRDPAALYEFGVQKEIRSYGVMKYKPRLDSEFKIVGFKKGVGKMKNSIVFIAETPEGKTFSVAPAWSIEEREKAYLEGDTYVGRMATIYYDTLSDTGIPVQPVLAAFVGL
jgi:hypothetical protein